MLGSWIDWIIAYRGISSSRPECYAHLFLVTGMFSGRYQRAKSYCPHALNTCEELQAKDNFLEVADSKGVGIYFDNGTRIVNSERREVRVAVRSSWGMLLVLADGAAPVIYMGADCRTSPSWLSLSVVSGPLPAGLLPSVSPPWSITMEQPQQVRLFVFASSGSRCCCPLLLHHLLRYLALRRGERCALSCWTPSFVLESFCTVRVHGLTGSGRCVLMRDGERVFCI